MPSAAAYTSKLRSLASARNVKIQYPGGVAETYRPDRTMMCTNYSAIAVDPLKQVVSTLVGPEILKSITSVATDTTGNVYMLDSVQFCVFRYDIVTGIVSVFAGEPGIQGNSGDGGYAINAKFVNPQGIATNSAGDVFVSDAGFNRIRRISSGANVISAYAGTGIQGYSGDGGLATAATFNTPTGISFDPHGNMFIADTGNNSIRRIDVLTGIITTVAGSGLRGLAGDCSTATIAQMNQPTGVVADEHGNIFIADAGNSLIRTVNTAGIISSLAGQTTSGVGIPVGLYGYSGDGDFSVYATLSGATQLALDSTGNLFVSDTGNNVIREIKAATKIIRTYAGNGVQTYGGDGSVLSIASFNAPTGIAIGVDGSWYIADSGNLRVRKALPGTQPVYAPPWFTPIAYRVLRSKYDPASRSLLTYCECPNFASYEPTDEIVPPNNCLGKIRIFGGIANQYWDNADDTFGGTAQDFYTGTTASGEIIVTPTRFFTQFYYGGGAANYAG